MTQMSPAPFRGGLNRDGQGGDGDPRGAAAAEREHQPYLPPVAPESPARYQLPADVRRLVGRTAELAELTRLAADESAPADRARVIVIAGKPGVGKTALARRFAHQVKHRYPDAWLYTELPPAPGPGTPPAERDKGLAADMLDDFLRMLGVEGNAMPDTLKGKEIRYRSMVSGQRVLVVIDGVTSSAQVEPLLVADSRSLIIVTSHSALRSLEPSVLSLEVLDENAAVELLGATAGTDKVGRESDAARAAVGHCGRLPLAIVIAGARLAARENWTVASLAHRLADPANVLTELTEGGKDVATPFSVSYNELSGAEKQLFGRLSVFGGPHFEAEAAAQLLDLPAAETSNALARLADLHLLEPAIPHDCYKFHSLLKSFATMHFQEDESEQSQRECALAVLGYYSRRIKVTDSSLQPTVTPAARIPGELTRQVAQRREKQEALDWLTQERENLVAAVDQALALGEISIAWKIASRLGSFFDVRAHYIDWRETHEKVLAALAARGPSIGLAVITRSLGKYYHNQHKWAEARARYYQALELFHRLKLRRDVGVTLLYLGDVHRYQRAWDSARNTLTVGLGILRATGFRRGEAIALRSLASVYCLTGDFGDALRMYDEALRIFSDLDDQRWIAATRLSICDVHLLRGEPGLARPGLQACLEVFRVFGDRHWEALTLRGLGDCHAQEGDFDAARECLDASLAVLKDLDDPQWQAAVLETIGEAYARQQHWLDAIDYYRRAIDVFHEASDSLWEARAHKNLGIALNMRGDRGHAEAEWSLAWLALIEQNAHEAREVDSLLYDGDGDGMAAS